MCDQVGPLLCPGPRGSGPQQPNVLCSSTGLRGFHVLRALPCPLQSCLNVTTEGHFVQNLKEVLNASGTSDLCSLVAVSPGAGGGRAPRPFLHKGELRLEEAKPGSRLSCLSVGPVLGGSTHGPMGSGPGSRGVVHKALASDRADPQPLTSAPSIGASSRGLSLRSGHLSVHPWPDLHGHQGLSEGQQEKAGP